MERWKVKGVFIELVGVTFAKRKLQEGLALEMWSV